MQVIKHEEPLQVASQNAYLIFYVLKVVLFSEVNLEICEIIFPAPLEQLKCKCSGI